MSKRSLSMLIAAALCTAGATAVQADNDRTKPTTPPPAAAASPTGQTHIPNPLPRHADDEEDATVHTQSPPNDPQLSRRVHSGFEGDRELEGDREVVYGSNDPDLVGPPVAQESFDDEVRVSGSEPTMMADERDAVAMQDGETPEVREGESDPFAEEAGSQGFSSGVTAQRAASQFSQLDSDGSGSLSEDELAQDALAQRFGDYDINNDGEIAENEFQSWFAAVHPSHTDDRALVAEDDSEFDDEDMLDADDD